MKPVHKGLAVAAFQLALLGAIGAKFLIDRHTDPRAWIETAPIDPDLPIRGRYVRLNAIVDSPAPDKDQDTDRSVRLEVRDAQLVAIKTREGPHHIRWLDCGAERKCWVLTPPLAYFIPEHVSDPSRRDPGETLWVEASLPPTGAPRPIRLGVKKNGALRVLELR